MSKVEVKIDNSLELTPIVDLLAAPGSEETDSDVTDNTYQTTKLNGIVYPLLKVNKLKIPNEQIQSMKLDISHTLPTLRINIIDNFGLITSLDKITVDNEVRLQILPRFDDVYKKINMSFYITSSAINGDKIRLDCIINIRELYESQLKSFGLINSYDLIKEICSYTKLGLASNVESMDDERYIYCNYKTYEDLLSQEIKWSGNGTSIVDCWVDYFNNINYVDIYERWNAIDDNLTVYSTGTSLQLTTETDSVDPIEIESTITNSPTSKKSELYTDVMKHSSNTDDVKTYGTDRLVSIYKEVDGEYSDLFIQDGDVNNDVFARFFYAGEVYGEYDYLTQKELNEAFLRKMNANTITVSLPSVMFGLNRGGKVNLHWWDCNSTLDRSKNVEVASNIPLPSADESVATNSGFIINKMISGQYLIIGESIEFKRQSGNCIWKHNLTLSRPQFETNTYVQD